jgi:hypothetical protein
MKLYRLATLMQPHLPLLSYNNAPTLLRTKGQTERTIIRRRVN